MQVAPLRALIALVLALLTVISSGCERLRPERTAASSGAALMATPPSGSLKEVAPPGGVQQLQERLSGRVPQVAIVAPANDALLPDGPWTLKLRVSDWPLSGNDGAELGPHLVVQLDQQSPLRISAGGDEQAITMPPLEPGSHRLTVYAARPWGEAVKAPGAFRQIRLHRVGRNEAELPAHGSAQLIVASPDGRPQQEPVLIDWLLLDAPLQNLRDDDARWRLRVSVNGDSFLVDRQTPLWLQGFHRGSNAVQLELLDGRGEPLNPPFNSVVREVLIGGADRPAWLRPSLNASELERLSGEASAPLPEQPSGDQGSASEPLKAAPVIPNPDAPSATPAAEPANEEPIEQAPADAESTDAVKPVAASPAPTDPITSAQPIQEELKSTEDTTEAADPSLSDPSPTDPLETQEQPAPLPLAAEPSPDRLSAGTSLNGSARDQVNADGSLLKPQRRGPLAGLREKLGA